MTSGYIHSMETMGLVDGPGIRTVVFLQGCRLRCSYCHNPDMWSAGDAKMLTLSPQELLSRLVRFKPYYGTEGGVTFSGGEPLLQDAFLREILPACQAEGIHTCLDTAGCGNGEYEEILSHTDLILFDVKHYMPEEYRILTGHGMKEAEAFLSAAQKAGTPLWIRQVLVPGLTDTEEYLTGLREYLKNIKHIQRVELLPYHTLGVSKYEALGIDYPLADVPPLPPDALTDWNERLTRSCCGVS